MEETTKRSEGAVNAALTPTGEILQQFTKRQLDAYAKQIGVPCGKSKTLTICRLLESGKVTIKATLATRSCAARNADP